MKKMMTSLLTTAMAATATTVFATDSILWHFNGKDGVGTPTSITDTTGAFTLKRGQAIADGQTYGTQMTQSDSKGNIVRWTSGGVAHAESSAGSIQMWRENTSGGYRGGCSYYINDDIKTILSTNSLGEIRSFTIELVYKAEPYDAATCQAKNMQLFVIGRGTNYGGGTPVLQVATTSTGNLWVVATSKISGNGDICKWNAIDESIARDGKWHHLAIVYTLDESASPHQGTIELFLNYVSQGTKTLTPTGTATSPATGETTLSYGQWDESVVTKSWYAGYLTIGVTSKKHSPQLSIDEVRVTPCALDEDDFMRVRKTGFVMTID